MCAAVCWMRDRKGRYAAKNSDSFVIWENVERQVEEEKEGVTG